MMEGVQPASGQMGLGFMPEGGEMPLDWANMTVGPEVLATLLGVSDRQIQKLAKKGHVEQRAHGKYHLRNSLSLYHKHLKQNAGSSVSATDDENYQKARTRREIALANIAERDDARDAKTVLPADEVGRAWEMIFAEIKTNLLNQMPRRLAALLKGESNESRAKQIIKSEMVDVLTQLSQMEIEGEAEEQ